MTLSSSPGFTFASPATTVRASALLRLGGGHRLFAFGDVRVDKCFHCEGMWLDKGELETMQTKEPGFMKKLLGVFRP